MHGNDLNAWSGPADNGRPAAFAHPLRGSDPNAFNEWTSPEDKKVGKVDRAIDGVLNGEVFQCDKCAFKTHLKENYISHMRKDSAGMVSCERERMKFAQNRASAAANAEEIAKAVSLAVGQEIQKGMLALAQAIGQRLNEVAPKGKKPKGKKGKKHDLRSPGGVLREAGAGGPEPLDPVESSDQSVADPSAESADPEPTA